MLSPQMADTCSASPMSRTHPGNRRHRLHRRQTCPASAGTRPRRPGPRPQPPTRPLPALERRRGNRRRRRSQAGYPASKPCRASTQPTTSSTASQAPPASKSSTSRPPVTSAKPRSKAGVRRIIYLGGLGDPKADLSPHLRSRQQTGDALRESGVSVTEFRAAVIVGSGSISFEMIRHLAERLPVMVCPKWVYSRIQPIAIDDLLEYLVSALNVPRKPGAHHRNRRRRRHHLPRTHARLRPRSHGLRRLLIPVPVLTPRLSSYWVHWMTPIPAKITRALVEGLRNEVVVTDNLSRTLFPHVKPRDYSSSIDSVIRDLDEGRIDTSWSDASDPSDDEESHVRLESRQGVIIESRRRPVNAAPEAVYKVVSGIGGRRGWFFANWTWSLRGMVDRLLGGAGLRRGRRHPDDLRVGDAVSTSGAWSPSNLTGSFA